MAAKSAKSPPLAPRTSESDGAAAAAAYIHLLRAYANAKDLQSGILIHDRLVSRGLDKDPVLADQLVHMYVKCGSLDTAKSVFQQMPRPGILSWTRIIEGHGQRGESAEAIEVFRRMLLEGVMPGKVTFIAAMAACCGSEFLPVGKLLQSLITAAGWDSCMIITTALIDMYIACGSLRDAVSIFQTMTDRDVVAWTAMISAFAVHGHLLQAFVTYRKMLLEGILPKVVTFLALINALSEERDWSRGRWIHRHITEMELETDVKVAVALITMFGRCGDLKKARRIFRRIKQPDLACYRALLVAQAENGEFWNSVLLSKKLLESGIVPDRETVLAALASCIRPADLELGKEIHVSVINNDLEGNLDVANALVYMYSKCRSLRDAEWMFQRMEKKNVISWRVLISAYVKHARDEQALDLFRKMLLEGYSPGRSACLSALRAVGRLGLLEQGRVVHLVAQELGLELRSRVVNELVTMYGRCKSLDDARAVFGKIEQPNALSWSSIVAACLESGFMHEALGEFQKMQLEGIKVERKNSYSVLFVNLIAACLSLRDLNMIYASILEVGLNTNSAVGNAMLDAYCRLNGDLEDAEEILEKMDHNRDGETWSLIFTLFAQKNETAKRSRRRKETEIESPSVSKLGRLVNTMLLDGSKPDKTTLTLVLDAYMEEEVDSFSVNEVSVVHSCIVELEMENDATIASLLLAVYGRCRALEQACALFNKYHLLGVSVWNAMIATFAKNGVAQNGFLLFQRMAREGVLPNKSTFVQVCAATGVTGASALEQGKIVHGEAVQIGVERDPNVATALIEMYAQCLCVEAAAEVFYSMEESQRGIASWDAMISAYLATGQREEALALLQIVQIEGLALQLRKEILQELMYGIR